MPSIKETVRKVLAAPTWDKRVAQIRLVTHNHGTADHPQIWAHIAREGYVPYLAPDFAYIHEAPFYETDYFREVYAATVAATDNFTQVEYACLTRVLENDPRTLLVLRTIVGLTKEEFAHSTTLVGEARDWRPLSPSKIDAMERRGTPTTTEQAQVAALALHEIMLGSLFPEPGTNLRSKQTKSDTEHGWSSVRSFVAHGVPYAEFLHQRHYGGAYRQVLDATSSQRGNLLEDAVEQLFTATGIPHIRTGSHNQGDIAARFEVRVTPAPDFVVFDDTDTLRAMLECKATNNGGTARDKAPRFTTLRAESVRLGGIPLLAVLSGMGWTRVNDTLGPVVRDTDGRVFTLATLPEMLKVAPFPALRGLRPGHQPT
ncbi:MAG: hypothetical protein ACRDRS_21830 [Pseudonocardiaceae bacterium]